ncbi:MAG: hypothetical protein ACO1RA_19965 [Planctomycetaceae bacterium]
MSLRLLPSFLVLVGLLVLSGTRSATADETQHFQINIDSTIDMEITGKKQNVTALTELAYQWRKDAKGRTLFLDSTFVKAEMNGQPLMNTLTNAEKFMETKGDKKTEILINDANDELKKILVDSYTAPICVLAVDASGAETERTIVAKEGAKSQIDNGIVANCTMFHPPYFADKQEWDRQTEFSAGNGAYVTGNLLYKKGKKTAAGQKVTFSGTLTNPGYLRPGTPLKMENNVYKITGEQTYDPASKEYVSGKLVIDVSFDLSVSDKAIGNAKGKMNLTFNRKEPAKK